MGAGGTYEALFFLGDGAETGSVAAVGLDPFEGAAVAAFLSVLLLFDTGAAATGMVCLKAGGAGVGFCAADDAVDLVACGCCCC